MAEGDTYCRLCAEPTPRELLISPHENVAVSSKISTKLKWINVDISAPNYPNTICFSCFDQLERTWSFLNTVQAAQRKLSSIFKLPNSDSSSIAGKPVDENWEEYGELKKEIKVELLLADQTNNQNGVKYEQESDQDFEMAFEVLSAKSSDSDMPLQVTAKKKKVKPKLKNIKKSIELDLLTEIGSWEDVKCQCAKCDAECKNIASLQIHSIKIHTKCCVYKCLECDKVLHTFKGYIKHVKTHRPRLQHYCEYCNKFFKLISECTLHKNKYHKDIFLKKCRYCGADFETTEELLQHNFMYNEPKTDAQMDLKCTQCNKEFKSKSNLQQHKQLHNMERIRDFSCHICGKQFFAKGTLITHMSTHEDKKPFKCPYCPLAFRLKGNLNSHISRHSGLKPFMCEQCGMSFRVKRQLKSHSIVHTDLMPYVCEYCNKKFRFKTRLNLHLRQHTGAKPYKCLYCQRDFTNGSNFKKHMRRRHGVDTSKQKFNNVEEVEIKDIIICEETKVG
ncbi:zinc finger protein 528-like [Leptidea sinapis]|uniref:zinc finger protein 528-like n=1 Tax=Leptidea sinapis TaxID=189913 RepID=UPI002129782E|nr:zinc finger protein 528-like [Leptidea sinapis]